MSTTTTAFRPLPRWFLVTLRVLCVVISVFFLVGAVSRILVAPRSLWTYVGVLLMGGIAGWFIYVFWHWERHDRALQTRREEAQEKEEPIQPPVPTRGNGT
jgi:hypothetical protein